MGENLYLSTSIYGLAVPVHDIDVLVPLGLADVGPGVERLGLPPSLEDRAMDDAMLRRGVAFIRQQGPQARVRPDQKVVFFQDWPSPEQRLKGTTSILRNLASLAKPAKAA